MYAVEIKNLEKTYKNGVHALKGVNLTINDGDFFGLLGANGAGKTTIIGTLTALVNKNSGTVKIFGIDIDKDFDAAKQMVGVVPQEFNFSIFEKVIDIVVTQAGYFGMPRRKAMEEAEKILTQLELWDKKDQPSRTLSGGMKRRLMIARGLIHSPKLLILDEPTAGVDVELRHGMWKYLRELNTNGTTVLMTTHYLEEAEQMCNNVAIIKQGEIIKNDSVKNLIRSLDSETYIVSVNKNITDEQLSALGSKPIHIDSDTFEISLGKNYTLSQLTNEVAKFEMEVIDIRPKGNRLEQLFLNILNS